MTIALRVVAIASLLLVVLDISTYCYRRSHPEAMASGIIEKFCKGQGLDVAKLRGPVPVPGNDKPNFYLWKYKDATHDEQFLVSLDFLYGSTIDVGVY